MIIKNAITINLHTPTRWILVSLCLWLLSFTALADQANQETQSTPSTTIHHSYAVAMHGSPKYAKDFTHFDYTNPDAPKGGRLMQYAEGGFDSFNPFIAKGIAADGVSAIYDSLLVSAYDEPFTKYGLIAESIEWPEDRSWVIFTLNPKARFHDGVAITAEDVKFTFDTLMEKGSPAYQYYYQDVESVTVLSRLRVKFQFKNGDNKELMLSVGDFNILPKHYWQDREFDKVTLDKPLGSGAYKIGDIQPNKRVVYERVKDYWAKNLPVNKGRNNFDHIIYDYYGESTVALEAFKKGDFNYFAENNSKRWATAHQGKPYDSHEIIKELIPHHQPAGMQGFAFNLRRPIFHDIVLRRAMNLAFDFEWSNKNLFYGQYTRCYSYFSNTTMAADKPITPEEMKLLSPYKDQLRPEVFTKVYHPPVTQGDKRPRANLLKAQKMLQDAGYYLKDNRLYNPSHHEVRFEFLIYSPAFTRIILPFVQNLKTLGIHVDIRRVDVTQYIARRRNFDYDMMVLSIPQSLSPGNEQRNKWHSSAADRNNSQNYIGIKDPVVDALVDTIIQAETREDLETASRALDRVLLASDYIIPNWYINAHRVSYHKSLAHTRIPANGLDLFAWWSREPSKEPSQEPSPKQPKAEEKPAVRTTP